MNRPPVPQRGNLDPVPSLKRAMKIFRYILSVVCCLLSIALNAQNSSRQKIAVFVPLYLDSAFDATNGYRYDKAFPKFINPGLEFYEGIQFALDSLNKENVQLEV